MDRILHLVAPRAIVPSWNNCNKSARDIVDAGVMALTAERLGLGSWPVLFGLSFERQSLIAVRAALVRR